MLSIKEIITQTEYNGKDALRITGLGDFSLSRTLDCGQCFRWDALTPDLTEHIGVAHGKRLCAVQKERGELILCDTTEEEYLALWRRYFSLDRDWQAIRADIEGRSPALKMAANRAEGIRILSQDPFEALISFIISQCNNIPRIKGLIAALCERYGQRLEAPDGTLTYAFPTPESILAHPLSSLTELKVGYRDEYIYSACRAVCEGIIDEILAAKTTHEAEQILTSMHGVGRKVAACVLLFGFGRLDAFPVDVWMKRALARNFPDCRDFSVFGQYAGVAQQYMFYAERYEGN